MYRSSLKIFVLTSTTLLSLVMKNKNAQSLKIIRVFVTNLNSEAENNLKMQIPRECFQNTNDLFQVFPNSLLQHKHMWAQHKVSC